MRAMILAAGKGTRLKDLTKTTPKCLVEVAGRPMLAHVADQLIAAGVREVVINLHHLADVVRERVVREGGFGLKVEFSLERELLGTGGGLRKVKPFFEGPDPFLLLNADIYSEYPLESLVNAHRGTDVLGTLLTMQREDSSYLLFDRERVLQGYEIVGRRFEHVDQMSSKSEQLVRGAFCGVQVLNPRIFDFMEGFAEEFSLIDVYLKAARAGERMVAQDLGSEFWIDMGTPEKLETLRRHLQK